MAKILLIDTHAGKPAMMHLSLRQLSVISGPDVSRAPILDTTLRPHLLGSQLEGVAALVNNAVNGELTPLLLEECRRKSCHFVDLQSDGRNRRLISETVQKWESGAALPAVVPLFSPIAILVHLLLHEMSRLERVDSIGVVCGRSTAGTADKSPPFCCRSFRMPLDPGCAELFASRVVSSFKGRGGRLVMLGLSDHSEQRIEAVVQIPEEPFSFFPLLAESLRRISERGVSGVVTCERLFNLDEIVQWCRERGFQVELDPAMEETIAPFAR